MENIGVKIFYNMRNKEVLPPITLSSSSHKLDLIFHTDEERYDRFDPIMEKVILDI